MGLMNTRTTKLAVCKKQYQAKRVASKEWQTTAKPSFVDLLDEEIDPVTEAHMSLTAPSTDMWDPLPLEEPLMGNSRDLVEDDVDPLEEMHMSFSSAITSCDLAPIPLESHDISWECELGGDEKAWEHLFSFAKSFGSTD